MVDGFSMPDVSDLTILFLALSGVGERCQRHLSGITTVQFRPERRACRSLLHQRPNRRRYLLSHRRCAQRKQEGPSLCFLYIKLSELNMLVIFVVSGRTSTLQISLQRATGCDLDAGLWTVHRRRHKTRRRSLPWRGKDRFSTTSNRRCRKTQASKHIMDIRRPLSWEELEQTRRPSRSKRAVHRAANAPSIEDRRRWSKFKSLFLNRFDQINCVFIWFRLVRCEFCFFFPSKKRITSWILCHRRRFFCKAPRKKWILFL